MSRWVGVQGRVSSIESQMITRNGAFDLFSGVTSHQIPDNARWSCYTGTAVTTMTWVMPNSPFDGQEVYIMSRVAITTLIHSTANATQNMNAGLTTLGAANPKGWVWNNTTLTWWKLV